MAGNRTPDDLVRAIVGAGIVVSNVQFRGVLVSAGTFTNAQSVIGFDEGIILSSGDIANVIGPNQLSNATRQNGLPGDTDLDSLILGFTTLDATVLEFDFVPDKNVLSFQYVFASEEYNEFANTSFNDVFGFFLNGTNAALLPSTLTSNFVVSINNVNGGNPAGTDARNPQFYRDNTGGSICTEMDGLTVVFNVLASVRVNEVNHIKLAIADAGDSRLDSAIFIKTGSFSANHPPTVTCDPLTPASLGSFIVLSATVADEDSDPLTVVWSVNGVPSAASAVTGGSVSFTNSYAAGTNVVTVAVSDGKSTATCDTRVIVVSNHAPSALCQSITVLNTTGGCTVAVSPAQVDGGSSDPDGDALTLTLTPPGPYPIGTNVVTLTATAAGGADTCQALIIVVDVQPPMIFCPTNLFVEFTGKTGAVVTYTAVAFDSCSGPAPVTFSPPSGSVLPIGVTAVTATARDAAGNASSCSFLVTVIGLHGTKSNLVSELQTRLSALTDIYSRTNLEHGLVQLQSAAKARKWIDQTHVTRAEGEDVFQGEEDIAEKLQLIISHHTSGVPDAIWKGYINRLLAVDRVLAEVQIDDAQLAGASAKKIADAIKLLKKGDAEIGKNRPDRAIENYFAAWEKALFAVIVLREPLPNGTVRLTIQGNGGTKYQIQFSTNGGGSWSNLAKPKADGNGVIIYLDTNPAAASTRIYRLLEP